jgi:cell division protein FtsQ
VNASLPTPMDIKLMNLTASVLFGLLAALVLVAASWWSLRHPAFALGGITVQGDLVHNNAVTLRANVAPKLSGNFFTVDLAAARAAFEAVPWVRQAVVRRDFPNRLKVLLQEHQAVAHWGSESDSRLLNSFGEVFEANTGDLDRDDLPRLAGPQGQSAEVLTMYRALTGLFDPLGLTLEALELTGRGGWRAQLDSGAEVELGRGTPQEVAQRAQRFVGTLTQVTSRYGRNADAIESADLRHGSGYALRLRGVTTSSGDAGKK